MTKKYLTKEQYEKLKEELQRLKTEERSRLAERIKVAKEFGDLSENSEYSSALEEQKELERRILELEMLLKEAEIVKESTKGEEIKIGSRVTVEDLSTKSKVVYQIVTSGEADPLQNKITLESPIGKQLVGKKVGDVVEIILPKKTLKYKILSIS